MIQDRKEARSALHTLLASALTSAQAGYKYSPHDFGGASPVFYLTGSGTHPVPMTGKGNSTKYYINVHILALYASNDVYTEELAEDTLDALEKELRQVLATSRRTANWQDIRYAGRSSADEPLQVGGDTYLHEVVPLVMEVY